MSRAACAHTSQETAPRGTQDARARQDMATQEPQAEKGCSPRSLSALRKAAETCSQGLLARRQAESSKQERQASPRHRRAQGSAGLHQYCSSSRCRAPRSINRPEGGDRKHEQHTLERAQRHSWYHEWGKAACARHGEPARAGPRLHGRRGCCRGRSGRACAPGCRAPGCGSLPGAQVLASRQLFVVTNRKNRASIFS